MLFGRTLQPSFTFLLERNAAYSAGAFPRAFGENILGVSGSPETILNAWFDASTSTSEGTAAAMGPMTTGGVTDMNECIAVEIWLEGHGSLAHKKSVYHRRGRVYSASLRSRTAKWPS
jgi:hypothetical protein